MPTRFPSGVSTQKKGYAFAEFPAPDPFRNVQYFDDFIKYTAADWTVTETGSATQAGSAGA